jgi:hypothetical protein
MRPAYPYFHIRILTLLNVPSIDRNCYLLNIGAFLLCGHLSPSSAIYEVVAVSKLSQPSNGSMSSTGFNKISKADANAACHGLVRLLGSIPNSASTCAAYGSFAVNSSATTWAVFFESPFF